MRGPSPLIPSLMLAALTLVIFWPTTLYVTKSVLLILFQTGGEEEGGTTTFVMVLIPMIILLLIHLLTTLYPTLSIPFAAKLHSGGSAHDAAEGYGLGTVLLVVLFFVLYSLTWCITKCYVSNWEIYGRKLHEIIFLKFRFHYLGIKFLFLFFL